MEYGNENPYQAPPIVAELAAEEGMSQGPPYKLFSVGAVLWATFLGSWFAGGVIMAINYWRVGRPTSAWLSAITGLASTVALLVLAMELPDDVPNTPFILIQLLLMYFAVKTFQGNMITQHARNRGELSSNWAAAGLALLACIPLVGFIVAYGIFATDVGTRYEVSDNEEIYYSAPATESDARQLARWLQDDGFFDGSSEATVLLAKTGGKYTVSFCVGDNAWEDAGIVEYYRELGGRLADDVFGRPLDIGFVDEYLDPRKTITIGDDT